MERVELHAHTNMSLMEGMSEPDKLLKYAYEKNLNGIAITDTNSVAAYPSIQRFINENKEFKVIYGISLVVDYENLTPLENITNISLLVKNQKGLQILYELISKASITGITTKLSDILEKRQNFLIGSGGVNSYLYKSALALADDETLIEQMRKFDYVEVVPPSVLSHVNYLYQVGNERFGEEEDYIRLTERLVHLGYQSGKRVVAISDSEYRQEDDDEAYRILQWKKGILMHESWRPKRHLRDTEKMLEEFDFLGKEEAFRIVVENTNYIADMIDELILPEHVREYQQPSIEFAKIEKRVWGKTGDESEDTNLSLSTKVIKYLESIFGKSHVIKAGIIGKVTVETAEKWVNEYFSKKHITPESRKHIINRLQEVRKTYGQHPSSIFIVPYNHNITDYTPVKKLPVIDQDDILVTHMDYHELGESLLKINVLESEKVVTISRISRSKNS